MPSSGFLDDTGHPRLRSSIVGFLDIMGFSQAIQNSTSREDSQVLIDRIVASLNDAREYIRRSLADDFANAPGGWSVKFFSDNLVVGYPFEGPDAAVMAARFIIAC